MSAMRTAVITGVAGQDGSYLAELLLAKDYTVVGTTRRPQEMPSRERFVSIACDITDGSALTDLLTAHRPAEVYNLAAMSSGAGMFDDPVGIGEVNGLAVATMLEAIRRVDPTIRFCQASSSEMFGDTRSTPQSEETSFHPRTPYGAAKLYAHSMLRIYRERYGLFACSAILFNHESPRRRLDFVTRKITHTAARIKLGLASDLQLGSLDARRDWGYAGDYMRAMWMMLQHHRAGDWVVATGKLHSVREVCEIAFGHLGLDWRHFVSENLEQSRATERSQLLGDPRRANDELHWAPQVTFEQLVLAMVDSDMQTLQATEIGKANAR
jgi:GDPmannose 4,6-dehydratase